MKFKISYEFSLFSSDDVYYFKEGTHYRLFDKLGSHHVEFKGKKGVYFAVWAPNAKYISVISDFNHWNRKSHPLKLRSDESGIWEGFIEGVNEGSVYKYYLESHFDDFKQEKSDPYAFFWEVAPKSSSRTWKLEYEWSDREWMETRHKNNALNAPISIYELHIGSWRQKPKVVTKDKSLDQIEQESYFSYRELADELVPYLKETGFTHVELLPITEYPFSGSWGYQVIGYFAPTARHGEPEEFMYFVDKMHQNGIGVILDWVPSHFVTDMHGLAKFDGTALYEHEDVRQGFHPEWGSAIFNFGRNEVKAFLISSALFWLEKYHLDGIRVDAVASMLYLNYARGDAEWIPNRYGTNENLEAIEFLKELNEQAFKAEPNILMIAEESTAWPMVTRPKYLGGLGFNLKWNMGWMHDSLKYMSTDPIFKKYRQDQITFSIWYAFHENFMLPLSHDEVVHGKCSLIGRMSGLYHDKFANLRLLYSYMFSHPGKKLLFMGGEFAQFIEWNYKEALDWHLLEYPMHAKMLKTISDLNYLYKNEKALHLYDEQERGFEWVDVSDHENSVISYLRKSDNEEVLIVCNFTPVQRDNYKIGVNKKAFYREIFNSDAEVYGGANRGNLGGVHSEEYFIHNRNYAINVTLPPLTALFFKAKV